jgi:hypothetical protein
MFPIFLLHASAEFVPLNEFEVFKYKTALTVAQFRYTGTYTIGVAPVAPFAYYFRFVNIFAR